MTKFHQHKMDEKEKSEEEKKLNSKPMTKQEATHLGQNSRSIFNDAKALKMSTRSVIDKKCAPALFSKDLLLKREQKRRSAGFTLLEMMIVLALIVVIFVMALPSITSSFQVSLNSTARDISTVVAESYNAAIITGKVYRVVYDLKEGKYWVEVGPASALLDTAESKEKTEIRKKFLGPNADKADSSFRMDKIITRKKKDLPSGVTFEDILTEQSDKPITEGIAYSHFFPHGLSEQTIIHIKDQAKHHASLVITSLSGQMDIYDRYIGKAEAYPK